MAILPSPYEDILITPVANAPFFIDDMFRKAYDHACPDFGQPLVCFYRKNWDHFVPLCFTLFWMHEDVMLNGGSVTNGTGFRHVPKPLSRAIQESEGLFFHILRYGFEYFKDDCEAFFATCGDDRAWEVSMKAGFQPTQYKHLIANFHKPMPDGRKEQMTDRIHELGPF
ncbi:MAG: hypothetical protein HKN57_01010 [Xanthomonadales bacterium]|nr:hypothetical protein [Gammaproteobacteria bacterium]MBT8055196.1 hypothetical protein [Gammaproteobacteria bacterium]NND55808.1 hypothetical protein [Xanthomonadales bacterium]NNK51351.1 hypothetical protein [Xanthomonadales bacterium]